MKENSMQDYKVQRRHFFLRKSLSCKLLEIRRGFGESVGVDAFTFWAAARSKLMDRRVFWPHLLGCWHLVNHFCPLWGFSWVIYDPSDLLFNIFDIWQLCLICSLPLLFQMSSAELHHSFLDEVYCSQLTLIAR